MRSQDYGPSQVHIYKDTEIHTHILSDVSSDYNYRTGIQYFCLDIHEVAVLFLCFFTAGETEEVWREGFGRRGPRFFFFFEKRKFLGFEKRKQTKQRAALQTLLLPSLGRFLMPLKLFFNF